MKTRERILLGIGLPMVVALAPLRAVERAEVGANAAPTPDLVLKSEKERLATAHAHFLTARMLENDDARPGRQVRQRGAVADALGPAAARAHDARHERSP